MTKEQTLAVLDVITAVAEAIEAKGSEGLPNGHLYAHCMQAMSLETYQGIIGLLKQAGRVRESNHVLYAVVKRPN